MSEQRLKDLIPLLASEFPKLEFTHGARKVLDQIVKTLDGPNLQGRPLLRDDIEKDFISKLKYLNEYGNYRVRLKADHAAPLSFYLNWMKNNELFMDGVLQFNGTDLTSGGIPAGSIPFGASGWWSVHS